MQRYVQAHFTVYFTKVDLKFQKMEADDHDIW